MIGVTIQWACQSNDLSIHAMSSNIDGSEESFTMPCHCVCLVSCNRGLASYYYYFFFFLKKVITIISIYIYIYIYVYNRSNKQRVKFLKEGKMWTVWSIEPAAPIIGFRYWL